MVIVCFVQVNPLPLRVTVPVLDLIYKETKTTSPAVGVTEAVVILAVALVPVVSKLPNAIAIYASCADATQSQVDVTLFQRKPTVNTLLITVVDGSVTPRDAKLAPQVIARAAPLSLKRMINFCPSVGVPLRFVVMLVMGAAKAVMVTKSQLSVLMVGVAEDVMLVTRGVILLLVNVAVLVKVTTGAADVQADPSDVNTLPDVPGETVNAAVGLIYCPPDE